MSRFIPVEQFFSGLENLSIRDTSSPSTFKEIYDKICSTCFVASESHQRRKTFDPAIDAEETVDLRIIGEIFPFVNREEKCKELLRCFGNMDHIRGYDFDSYEHLIYVPLCVGLPGLGKTRYARIALTSLIKSFTDIPFPTMEDMLGKADEVARIIWGNDRTHDELLVELIKASHEDRNICITLNCTQVTYRQPEIEISISVLVQWMKHRQLKPEFDQLKNEHLVSSLDSAFGILREECLHGNLHLSFGDVVDFILKQDSQVHGSSRVPALIINLDKAQTMGELLQHSLKILVTPILARNSRVFITVTGRSKAHLFEAIERFSVHVITLPLLKDAHVADILAKVLKVDLDAIPRSVRNAVKWLGGVPRFLECFLESTAEISNCKAIPAMWKWLCEADLNSLMDVIIKTRFKVTGYGAENKLPDDLLDNIFSLATAGRPIFLYQQLVHGDSMWTVEAAQNQSLLHWSGIRGGRGIVVMPPLLLHHIHLNSAHSAGASIQQLKRPPPFMSTDDIEVLAVSALLHKLKAAAIVGVTEEFLYKDLMGGMKIEGVADIQVTVPKCFNLEFLGTQIDVNQFERIKGSVTKFFNLSSNNTDSFY